MKKVMVALKERNDVVRLTATAVALAHPGAEVEVTHVAEVGQGQSFAEADATLTAALELLRAHGLEARGDLEGAELALDVTNVHHQDLGLG